MINSKWLWGVMILLIGLNISSLLKMKYLKNEAESFQLSQERISNKYHTSNRNTITRNSLEKQTELRSLPLDMPLISATGKDTISLETLMGRTPKLVLHYSELNCMQCVDQEVANIKKLAKEIGRENIIIVAIYENVRDLFLFKRANNLKLPIYKLPNEGFGLPLEKANVPFLFMIDKEFQSKLVFVPEKTLPSMSEEYYRIIKSRFF